MAFRTMDPAKHREISSKGGKTAHALKRAHTFSPDEAKVFGAKGGRKTAENREHMRKIGARGGATRKAEMAAKRAAAQEAVDEASVAL